MLRWYASLQQYQQGLKEKAEGFRRETLFSLVFYRWWSACQLSLDLRLMERMVRPTMDALLQPHSHHYCVQAVLHHEDVVKKGTLTHWRLATRQRLQQYTLEVLVPAPPSPSHTHTTWCPFPPFPGPGRGSSSVCGVEQDIHVLEVSLARESVKVNDFPTCLTSTCSQIHVLNAANYKVLTTKSQTLHIT